MKIIFPFFSGLGKDGTFLAESDNSTPTHSRLDRNQNFRFKFERIKCVGGIFKTTRMIHIFKIKHFLCRNGLLRKKGPTYAFPQIKRLENSKISTSIEKTML